MTDHDALWARLRSAPAGTGPLPGFDPERAPGAPGALFADWLGRALDEAVPEPRAMVLSTADAAGRPSCRVLLLRGFELDGDRCAFRFASDAGSRKGAELAVRPHAALTWYWPRLGRQVRAVGPVAVLDVEAARTDFRSRGTASRTAGFTGRMSAPMSGPDDFHRERRRARALLAADPEAVPAGHRVYRLDARSVEFFQLAAEGFHRRLRYARDGDAGWGREQLWP